MTSQTLSTPAQRRDAAIAAYDAAMDALRTARASDDKTAVLKAAGRLGTPKAQIVEAEVDMELDGESYTPWTPPADAVAKKTSRSGQTLGTADEVQAEIDRLRKVQAGLATKKGMDAHAKAAGARVTSLLKKAKEQGLAVK